VVEDPFFSSEIKGLFSHRLFYCEKIGVFKAGNAVALNNKAWDNGIRPFCSFFVGIQELNGQ